MPDVSKTRRRDAEENRVALLAAARSEFSRDGYGVPLGRVADAAHVSRATLYRHFETREDLIAAIAEADIAGVEEFAAVCVNRPNGLLALLDQTWRVQEQSPGVVAARGITNRKMLRDHDVRTRAAFAPVLEAAISRGEVRAGIDIDDVMIAILMVHGALIHTADSRARVRIRARNILCAGIFAP